MIEWSIYQIRLWRLQRDRAKTVRAYRPSIVAAQASKNHDDVQAALASEWSELSLIDEQADYLRSRSLLSKAARRVVEAPPDTDEFWEVGHYLGRRTLTTKGVARLRTTLRREAHESSRLFLTWIAALTGLIGALTGLFAVIP